MSWSVNGPGRSEGSAASGTEMYNAETNLSIIALPDENALFTGWSWSNGSNYNNQKQLLFRSRFTCDNDYNCLTSLMMQMDDSVYNQLEMYLGQTQENKMT